MSGHAAPRPEGTLLDPRNISIVIPTWNGRRLLERCLPPLCAALEQCPGAWEIIVVDDASADGTEHWLAREWPQVRVEAMPRRRGFVHAANRGMDAARFTFVCLLNNDMEIAPDFFPPIFECFEDERVFAVSAQARDVETGALNIGRRVRYIENNEIKGGGREEDAERVGYTLFASGGASVFRTQAVRDLGGLDTMYAPFYIEDADLGYRAWKRGWIIVYEPRATAKHVGGASIYMKSAPAIVRLLNGVRVRSIIHRNATLFYIKNITDPDLWASYKWLFVRWAATNFVKFRWTYLLGMAAALPRLGHALAGRRIETRVCSLTDRKFLDVLNSDYEPQTETATAD